ncbi:hypothetical protein, partial [Chryseobacterium sp. GVT01B]|uniref:hypothetical protein n=1 Tax=Chryseobacterium sp. GVT01B TaxID=2862675 RepID=UPI001CBB13D0
QKLSPPAPMVLRKRESRPPPVFILFLKILYLMIKDFFCFIHNFNPKQTQHNSKENTTPNISNE